MIKFDESKAGKDAPENLKLSTIAITGHLHETDNPYRNIPQDIQEKLHDLHKLADKGHVQGIKKLERLVERYPRVPILFNFLSIAYLNHGNTQKFNQLNELMLKRFPDYTISRINQANQHIINGEFDEAEALLGYNMELSEFLPNRQIFHISEVCQYYETTIRYFIHKREFENVDNRLKMLKDISKQFDDYHKEKIKKLEAMIEEELDEMRYENLDKYVVEDVRKEWVEKSDIAPVFTHPEIQWLYEYGLEIPKEKIEQILALPRPTLIQDLNKVIDDAMARFDYFYEKDWNEDEFSFPTHALFLLAELRATESLSKALNLIRQDSDWMEYWFGDMLTETFPVQFYKMIGDDLSILKQYLLEPNNEIFQRTVVTTALTILAYHHPERRQESIAFLADILNDFYENRDNYKDIIDFKLNEFIVSHLIELQSTASFPLIEKVYNADMISGDICGDLEDIKTALFSKEDEKFTFDTIPTIFEDYQEIISWNKTMSEEDETARRKRIAEVENELKEKKNKIAETEKKLVQSLGHAKTEMPKAGRNDPCPCGSGKKYKKCHGA